MKNELYYSSHVLLPVDTTHTPFSFIKSAKFLLLLLLSFLGALFYFNQDFVHKLINSNKVKENTSHEKLISDNPIIKSQSIEKKDKLTQKELERIANEIVKSLKAIEEEKKLLEQTSLKTDSYEEAEKDIESIENDEKIITDTIKKIKEETHSKTINNHKKVPYAEEVTESKKEDFIQENPIQESYVEKENIEKNNIEEDNMGIYTEENNIETYLSEEFSTVEPSSILSKDILETLSVELNHVVETSFDNNEETIPLERGMLETYTEEVSNESFLY